MTKYKRLPVSLWHGKRLKEGIPTEHEEDEEYEEDEEDKEDLENKKCEKDKKYE